MIRILLADDHEVIRSGLKYFMSSVVAHPVIHEAWDGNSTMEKVKENEYQLIIMDLNMPQTNCFELLADIIDTRPDTKILIFSINPEDVHAKRYLQLGAKGYVNKNAPPSELGNAIITILENKLYISPSLSDVITGHLLSKKTGNPFDILSAREFEIVQQLIQGRSLTDIRVALHLKSSTVSTYKGRIFEKLKCNNIIEVVQLAKLYNILPSGI
ncbi:MAG TPA: response regulator transcription factor [Chitinophagaceae bacterium]|nr:response regulator transcription factor [Chitinophagaceae bacterium]